jgi:5-methylcytosine-specific restriction endonuclease McrA
MSKTPRINLPKSVKKYILKRDKYQCQSCGKTEEETKLNIDHIIPLAKGGSNDISNLQTLCSLCNQKKKHHLDARFNRYFTS